MHPSSRKPSRRRGYPGPFPTSRNLHLTRSRFGPLLACRSHRSDRDDGSPGSDPQGLTQAGRSKPMQMIDVFTHIFPERYYTEMTKASASLGSLGERLRAIAPLFDLDARFRQMDSAG